MQVTHRRPIRAQQVVFPVRGGPLVEALIAWALRVPLVGSRRRHSATLTTKSNRPQHAEIGCVKSGGRAFAPRTLQNNCSFLVFDLEKAPPRMQSREPEAQKTATIELGRLGAVLAASTIRQ